MLFHNSTFKIQNYKDILIGWSLAVVSAAIYFATLAPTVSFWDCGEFIATSYTLQVGHPPGAPLYQLMAHLFTLFASSPQQVAWWSNACSAVCAAVTVALLYWIILLIFGRRTAVLRIAAVVGAACYMVCDTAWFSAVESEVYAMAMLMAALIVYCILRWYADGKRSPRLLVLTALLTGMAACVHLMCLLALPVVTLLLVSRDGLTFKQWRAAAWSRLRSLGLRDASFAMLCAMMFVVGITPYIIIPIRAAANPPINSGHPDSVERFMSYVKRDQYAHAPIYPRMWRSDDNSKAYASSWSGGNEGVAGEITYYLTYQLGYMYGRYLLWNFCGRQNTVHGYGGLQNGQFATGIPVMDRMIVGSGERPPDSLPGGRAVYFLLPLLLGLIGMLNPRSGRVRTWAVWLLFLFGGVLLNVYLNHPAYEPRERDYAYVMSFFAFCIWVAFGVAAVAEWAARRRKWMGTTLAVMTLGVPLLMGCQNWESHDRSDWQTARDVACNILGNCGSGSLLFAFGDNDTFPLWYVQEVEGQYRDVEMYNINLIGFQAFYNKIEQAEKAGRAVYFTGYAQKTAENLLQSRSLQVGCVSKMCTSVDMAYDPSAPHAVAADEAYDNIMHNTSWHLPEGRYLDETAHSFIKTYWDNVLDVAADFCSRHSADSAQAIIVKTLGEIPDTRLLDLQTRNRIAYALSEAGNDTLSQQVRTRLIADAQKEKRYFDRFSSSNRQVIHSRIEDAELFAQENYEFRHDL